MRNDVKLGFAIGGVLLAVLIVYVLVVPGGSNTKQTRVDTSKKTPDGGKVTLEPIPATQASAPPAAPAGEFTPGAVSGSANTELAMDDTADKAAKVVDPIPPAKTKDIDWSKLLNGQALMTETPTPAGNSHASQGAEGKAAIASAAPSPTPAPTATPEATVAPQHEEIVRHPGGGVSIYPPPDLTSEPAKMTEPAVSPATRPSGIASARTHRVQSNETLSSIAAAAYGNPNLWPAIVKANPGLDPNRMKVGQTVILPDLQDVKPADPQNASARIAPTAGPLDNKHYRVQSGDSLHKISVHLYGKSTLADQIYELNKQTIGDDPARLKVGQVLVLPETPTVTSAR